MPETYTEEFPFAGKEIVVECEYISGDANSLIRDHIRKDDFAMAEVSVLRNAVQKIEIDGETKFRGQTRAARRGRQTNAQDFPRLRHERTHDSLADYLLGLIVAKREVWLAKKEPFDEVFEPHFDNFTKMSGKPEEFRADPTPSRADTPDLREAGNPSGSQ